MKIPKLILQDHHQPDTKNQKKMPQKKKGKKERKLQACITEEHKYKNAQQNSGKQHTTH